MRQFSKRLIVALFVVCPVLAIISQPLAAQDTPTPAPNTQATPAPIEATFGSGSFNLLSPTIGLADLSSYHATLVLSFDGTHAGQAEKS